MDTLIKQLRSIFDLESSGRVMVFSAIVGVVSGLGAALFYWVLNHFERFMQGGIIGYYPPGAGSEPASHAVQVDVIWWAVLLVPTLGGLICGLLVYTFAPEAEGHGTDGVVKAFHRLKGSIRARVPLIKGISSAITIGTGGSAGREGPIAQIGAGFGSLLADRLKMSDWERRMLMMAGAAGGIGAIFRAPLGGALFAVEVLYASTAIEFSAIVPCVVSSVVAYSIFSGIFGPGLAFTTPDLVFGGAHELPFYLVFAIICSLAGYAYVWIFYGMRDRVFKRLPIPNHVKPAIGGFLLGLLALNLPQVMSGGYGWIQQAIDGQLTLGFMATLVFAKIMATSFTISSGGSGGVFAPSLFIGAMLGGAYGTFCGDLFPDLAPEHATFVLVGMGGFFAGVAKVPLCALVMVSEMSGSYDLLVPLMLVSVINVALLSQRWSLYEEQVSSLIDSPAHLGDFVVDVLEGIKVREVYQRDRKPCLIHEGMTLSKVLHVVAGASASYFPVVDEEDLLVGIFSLHDIRSSLVGEDAGDLILASDIATTPVATVTAEDNIHTALRLYTQRQIAELPVVDPENPRRVIGMLQRGEVINAYDQQVTILRGRRR